MVNSVPTRIVDGLYVIPIGSTNTFLLDSSNGCTLIDAGFPESTPIILGALRELGRRPEDLRHIVLTHGHIDHIGGYAELKRATGASAYIHPLDAAIVEEGRGFRQINPSPGLVPGLMYAMFTRPIESVTPAIVEHRVRDGDTLPIAGGLKVIHAPGHSAGQIALLWPQRGGVLFAADTCMNVLSLNRSMGYEDLEEGERSLRRLSMLHFQIACFGHGKTILHDADEQFRQKWNPQSNSNHRRIMPRGGVAANDHPKA